MSIIYLILPIALILAGASVAGFIWAAKKGQYDDLDTPPLRMLLDDEASYTTGTSDREDDDEQAS